jgi:DNA polymerase sigma
MVEDPLGIFHKIKKHIKNKWKGAIVYAIGSRATGYSYTNKRDFDLIVFWKEMISPADIKDYLESKFEGEKDEFGSPIKIDAFTSTYEHEDKVFNGAILL